MRTLLLVAFFCIILDPISAGPNEPKSKTGTRQTQNNGLMGVASVAGITSRNGRVSALTGVKVIPQKGTIAASNDGGPYFYPLTVTKTSEGNIASGTIQLYPGSVIVSSSAQSGYRPELKPWPKIDLHSVGDIFLPPLDLFHAPRSIESWIPKDIFKPIPPPPISFESPWSYPNLNPFFSFWR